MLFVQKSFWRPSKARYLVKEIKTYNEIFVNKRGSKDLVSVGAFFGRIELPPAVMGWAASYDDGP